DAGRTPDRVIHAQPGCRQPAANSDGDERHHILRDRVRAWAWIARHRSRARQNAFDRLGATRVARLSDVSTTASGGAGVRQVMTESAEPDRIALPAPTVWPMVLALGVTLGLAGLVTHLVVSVVGVGLALVGGVGWWRCVLPEEKMEYVPVVRAPSGPPPVVPRTRGVERYSFGDDLHRLRLPVEVQPLSAGVRGGLVGGLAMAICAAIYGIVVQRSVWYPLNLLAAIAVPHLADADVSTLRAFDGLAFVVGIVAHV